MGCGCGNYSFCNQCFKCSCQQDCWDLHRGDDPALTTCYAACPDTATVPEGQDPTDIVYGYRAPSWPSSGNFDFFAAFSTCLPGGYNSCLSACAPDYTSCTTDYDTCVAGPDATYSACITACAGDPGCIAGCTAAHDAAVDACCDTEQACFKPLYDAALTCGSGCITSYASDIKLALKGTGTSCSQTNCFGESIGSTGDFSQCMLDEVDNLYDLIWAGPMATYISDTISCEQGFSLCSSACGCNSGSCVGDCVDSAWNCHQNAYADFLDGVGPLLVTSKQNQALCMQAWLLKTVEGEKAPACFGLHQGDLKSQDATGDGGWVGVMADLQRCTGNCPAFAFADEFIGDQITCIGLCNIAAEKEFHEAGRFWNRATSCRNYFPMSAHYNMRDTCRAHCDELAESCIRITSIALGSCVDTCCGDLDCIADCASAWEPGAVNCNGPLDTCLTGLEDDDFDGMVDCLTAYDTCAFSATPLCNSYDCRSNCDARFPLGDCPNCGDEGSATSDTLLCLSSFFNYRGKVPPQQDDYTCD